MIAYHYEVFEECLYKFRLNQLSFETPRKLIYWYSASIWPVYLTQSERTGCFLKNTSFSHNAFYENTKFDKYRKNKVETLY